MASDINKMTRLLKLVSMLRRNSFPNHATLEKELRALDATGQFKISQKTIQRDVLYLQAEYNAPIEFDYRNNGEDADWGNSRDSIERAVWFLTSREPK